MRILTLLTLGTPVLPLLDTHSLYTQDTLALHQTIIPSCLTPLIPMPQGLDSPSNRLPMALLSLHRHHLMVLHQVKVRPPMMVLSPLILETAVAAAAVVVMQAVVMPVQMVPLLVTAPSQELYQASEVDSLHLILQQRDGQCTNLYAPLWVLSLFRRSKKGARIMLVKW